MNQLTQKSQEALHDAQTKALRYGHPEVDGDNLPPALLDVIEEGPSTPAGRLISEHGLTRDSFLEILTEIRGNQRVTSANPEVAYEALEKYGIDLVDSARSGKLDPVIGRDSEIRRVIQ